MAEAGTTTTNDARTAETRSRPDPYASEAILSHRGLFVDENEFCAQSTHVFSIVEEMVSHHTPGAPLPPVSATGSHVQPHHSIDRRRYRKGPREQTRRPDPRRMVLAPSAEKNMQVAAPNSLPDAIEHLERVNLNRLKENGKDAKTPSASSFILATVVACVQRDCLSFRQVRKLRKMSKRVFEKGETSSVQTTFRTIADVLGLRRNREFMELSRESLRICARVQPDVDWAIETRCLIPAAGSADELDIDDLLSSL
jgi:hypothetical protein